MSLALIESIAFQGGVSTTGNGWPTDDDPGADFRKMLLSLGLNGDVPMTALTNLMSSEAVGHYKYEWAEEKLPTNNVAAAIYENVTLAQVARDATTFAVGANVYAKMAEADCNFFVPGKTVMMRNDSGSIAQSVTGIVINRVPNGANSYLEIKLTQAGTGKLDNTTHVTMIGSAHKQGGTRPNSTSYKGSPVYNYTQIFRTAYTLTRTAAHTKVLRFTGPDPYQKLRQKKLLEHSRDIERTLWFGERYADTTGDEPFTQMRGIYNWIQNSASQNFVDMNALSTTYSDVTGKTFEEAGPDFMDAYTNQLFLYGSGRKDKMCFCGSSVMSKLNKAARAWGHISITPGATDFGLRVTEWQTPYGRILFKVHPEFQVCGQWQNMAIFVEPQFILMRIMDDTNLYTSSDTARVNSGKSYTMNTEGYDGVVEEYLTELGMELHFPEAHGVLQFADDLVAA